MNTKMNSEEDQPLHVKSGVVYKNTSDGIDLHLDLHYPVSQPSIDAKYPVVVYTHGGGYCGGSHKLHGGMSRAAHGLVKSGFCVVSVEYRLKNKEYNLDVLIRDCVIDAKDAIRYLSKHPSLCVDVDRLFLFGDSAGAQIAMVLLLSPPDSLPGAAELAGHQYTTIAGVSWYGPCDFQKKQLFSPDGQSNCRDRWRQRIFPRGTNPAQKKQMYREISPINYLTKDSPPLLMIQGDKDTTIPVHHAHYMKERADELGAPVDILIVKNAGHNFRRIDPGKKVPTAPSKKAIADRTFDFFAKFLE